MQLTKILTPPTTVFFLVLSAFLPASVATARPLDDYVAAPDASYTYSLVSTNPVAGYTFYVYDMTSQSWRDEPAEVDRALWKHWLTIIVPDTLTHTDTALLFVSDGDNGSSAPTSALLLLWLAAVESESIVIELNMIPNQRIAFADETDPRYILAEGGEDGRTEDELLAYTWDKFIRTGDPTWVATMPMTKAVVRAMDTVQSEYPSIQDFVVAGGSKRGLTTWNVGAVDNRVSAMVPIVSDILNMVPSFIHHWDAYGYWADAIHDYEDMGIMDRVGRPELRTLANIVDPYAYRNRYTMPKYLVNSTGDQFFLPDSSQFYFDDLPGPKHLRYVPNTDHFVNSLGVLAGVLAYYVALLNDETIPDYSWTKQEDGSLRVETATAPSEVLLWQATNPTERNFRLDTIGAAWTSTVLSEVEPGVYLGEVPEPATGWTAFLVELTYPGGGSNDFKFTTEVSVVPDELPFDLIATLLPVGGLMALGALVGALALGGFHTLRRKEKRA